MTFVIAVRYVTNNGGKKMPLYTVALFGVKSE
jgi:hypothetical protein